MADRDCEYINEITRGGDGDCFFNCAYGGDCGSDDFKRCAVYSAAKEEEKRKRGLGGIVVDG